MELLTMSGKLLTRGYLHGHVSEADSRDLHRGRLAVWGWVIPIVLLVCTFAVKSDAQLTILHNFGDGSVPGDGAAPESGLTLAPDGNFYGTTENTAEGLNGTGYQITPPGTETILYTFQFETELGFSNLFYYSGDLIGPSGLGGVLGGKAGSYGLVYATPVSGTTAFWHKFHDGTVPHDGSDPRGGLILGSDGFLSGTTTFGGANNLGTIYKIDPTTQKLTIVHSFSKESSAPWAGLLLANDGSYYGTTTGSSAATDFGGIFKMPPKGKVSFVYKFTLSGTAGYFDYTPLIQASDGNFYGVCGS